MNPIFAQLEPDIHWPLTLQVLCGGVGLLSIVWLILSVAIACRKLFGKQPPMHEAMAALRKEFLQNDDMLLSTIRAESAAREKAISDINASRALTLAEINKKIEDMPGRIVRDLLNAKNLFHE